MSEAVTILHIRNKGGRRPYQRRRAFAFTLLELLIVAALLAVLAGALAPRLNGAYRILQFRGEIHRMTSMINYATELAIRHRTEVRVHFNQGGDLLWLEGEGLDPSGGQRSPFHHPGRKISIQSDRQNLEEGREIVLQFYPDGTRTEEILWVSDASGRERWIEIGRSFATLRVTTERPGDEPS
jgi:prepilin-type N-terminal cleavage/methylation domain-containing protein